MPCYNEEKRFAEGFAHYYNFLKNYPKPWELIFVNDGSSDQTLSLMKTVAKKNSNIKIVSYKNNQGKGFAITTGIQNAKGDIVLFTDLDHSVAISTIKDFLVYFNKGFDVVIGSRRVKGSKFLKKQHPLREFLGKGFTFLVQVFVDFKIKDATCGFKAFRKGAAQKIFPKLTVFGWAFDAEILYLCKKYKIKYAQAPVTWKDVKGSKVSIVKDIFGSFAGLVKIRLNDFQGKYW